MLPLRDENPTRITPYVTYSLIGLNILVFLIQQLFGAADPQLVFAFAMVPAQVTGSLNPFTWATIFTSMFMHGGLAHIGGNMLYLWIFGDNVEESMGHVRYLLFYLLGGVVASLAHILTNPNSQVPTVGASGAIAAVLGAYLVLFPQSRVLTLIPLGFFIRMTMVPAAIVLGSVVRAAVLSGCTLVGRPGCGRGGLLGPYRWVSWSGWCWRVCSPRSAAAIKAGVAGSLSRRLALAAQCRVRLPRSDIQVTGCALRGYGPGWNRRGRIPAPGSSRPGQRH